MFSVKMEICSYKSHPKKLVREIFFSSPKLGAKSPPMDIDPGLDPSIGSPYTATLSANAR